MNVFFLTKMHVYEDLIMQALEILGLFMNNARWKLPYKGFVMSAWNFREFIKYITSKNFSILMYFPVSH